MFGERIFLARNEKKRKHRTVIKEKAQSTLEYALLFPLLFLLILGVYELAFMWHQFNTVELVAREISANVVLSDNLECPAVDKLTEIVKKKTAILQERELSFSASTDSGVTTITSSEQYKGKPFVVVKIDCSATGVNSSSNVRSVQVQGVHRLRFFMASLPNFKTGERIIIIPDNVVLTSEKITSIGQN